ncbi:MAG: hypothetical protein J5563_07570 [Clostridia bacterium]|nr:hypothetical protein [Clostridia bacterium]
MGTRKISNLDFSPPSNEFIPLTDQENRIAPEYSGITDEYASYSPAPAKTEKKMSAHEMMKKMFLAPVLGIITVLTVASSAFGTDMISSFFGDILGSLGIGFPNLPNLEPNGYVSFMDYGVMDEEYVILESRNGESVFLWAGAVYEREPVPIEGAEYDRESNTLSLTDFRGDDFILNVNLMGNGFTLCLEGENTLGEILMWGFYYGGSLKIVGEGNLTVNANQENEYGIYFQAEHSESCLMIDRDVEFVDVYGTQAAFYVSDSTHGRGMYVASGLSLTGGRAAEVENVGSEYPDEYYEEEHHMHEYNLPQAYDYSIFENGEMSKHITVSH